MWGIPISVAMRGQEPGLVAVVEFGPFQTLLEQSTMLSHVGLNGMYMSA